MTRLARLSAALAILFTVLMLAARLVGARTYQTPALLAGIGPCDDPCWNGIVLGQTVMADADKLLNAQGYFGMGAFNGADLTYRAGRRDCWIVVSVSGPRVVGLRFSRCEPVALGDLMLALGLPDRIAISGRVVQTVTWRDGRMIAAVIGWPSPRARIAEFSLSLPSSPPLGTPWHGFMPLWRYCRLERLPSLCPL